MVGLCLTYLFPLYVDRYMKKLLERTVIPQGLQMGTMLKPSSLSTNEELLQMQKYNTITSKII